MSDAHNFISASLNQQIKRYFPYTQLHEMINTPTRFVARCSHYQRVTF
jgi:hypothetical protein